MGAGIGRRCLILGALAASALITAGCASSTGIDRGATYAGLVLRPPASWVSVGVEFSTAAVVQPLGYLTTQTPVAECRPDATGHTACGPPVVHLARAGVLVIVSSAAIPAEFFRPTATVAGLPATIERSRCVSCPAGASYQIKATVHVPSKIRGSIKIVYVDGYFGTGDTRRERRAFDHMLATARHH